MTFSMPDAQADEPSAQLPAAFNIPRIRISSRPRICIVSAGHLWKAPRIVKEADTLTLAGFEVCVVSPILTEADQAQDEMLLQGRSWIKIAAPNLLAPDRSGLARQSYRFVRRASALGVQHLGLPLASSLGYGIGETIQVAAGLNADLYSCHNEIGLVAFQRLSAMGKRCVVDFEDWYSRDLSAAAQSTRPISLLIKLERLALQKAAFTVATSNVMADALVAANGGARPLVVYNAFDPDDAGPTAATDRRSSSRPSLHWYSQTVGPGRGLETLFDALNLVREDFELHIRGAISPPYQASLVLRLTPHARQRVFFRQPVSPAELPSRIADHDIGLALEERSPASRDLTITNKVFQYLQAGCAVVASRTAGQTEAAGLSPEAVFLTTLEPNALAQALTGLIGSPERLAAAQTAARQAAIQWASWKHISPGMVKAYCHALDLPVPRSFWAVATDMILQDAEATLNTRFTAATRSVA